MLSTATGSIQETGPDLTIALYTLKYMSLLNCQQLGKGRLLQLATLQALLL